MTSVLLDTNVLLLFVFTNQSEFRRSTSALSPAPTAIVSQVCAIEMAIKFSIGKLSLPRAFQTDFARAFAGMVADLSANILPIELKHIDRLSRLPLFHRDPFDRLIIAQSLEDDLTVMTRDRAFSAYPGLKLVTL